jgi:hypothetical protein
MLMGVGNADGTGDGVMIAKDVQQLAYSYCRRGVPVEFHVYSNDNHDEAAAPFEAEAVQFLQQRYGGQSITNECSSITPGNPLTPLPAPRRATSSVPHVKLRYLGPNARQRGLLLGLSTTTGVLRHVTVELDRGNRVEATATLARLTPKARRLILRVGGGPPPAGRYTLVIAVGRVTALRRTITVR